MRIYKPKPPLIPSLLLNLFGRFSNDFSMLGDMDEEFYDLLGSKGYFFAKRWYWRNFLKTFPSLILESIYWNIAMFGNYIKIALRNLYRNKTTSFINVAGLSLGMACAILIFLWVHNQMEYDQNQSNKDNIYRLESETWVIMPPYLADVMPAFPEVKETTRLYFWWTPTLKYDETVFTIEHLALSDSNVFKVFDFDFILGSAENAFSNPYTIVLTESTANKLFGNDYPLGQKVWLTNKREYTVSAVIKDVEKFQMEIDALVSAMDMVRMDGNDEFLKSRSYNFLTYLLLSPGVDISELVQKINTRARDVFEYDSEADLLLRPFNEIYFNNDLNYESHVIHGNFTLIIMFSVIAVLIFLIACINFINLTIANASRRAKEIAVRKVIGAQQFSIQKQFFGETFLVVILSFIFSLLTVYSVLPMFSNLTGENIEVSSFDMNLIFILFGMLLFTTFISAGYPALYLSALKPVVIFKGKNGAGKKENLFSKILLSFQFAVSIFLIIATWTVFEQMNFVQTKDLGMDHEQMLTVTVRGDRFSGEVDNKLNSKKLFKQKLMEYPDIAGITYVTQLPGRITNTWGWYVDDPNNTVATKVINTNPDFVDVMGLHVVAGRTHSFDMPTDFRTMQSTDKFVINETAAKALGLEDAAGKIINGGHIEIIGVIKDFHFNSLHTPIGPLALSWNQWPQRAIIKIKGTNLRKAIAYIEDTYREFCPGFGFEYDFLDESFAREYKKEQQLESLLSYFVGIAITLSCLGLFALTAFMTERRIKEIGIRKVLGASNPLIILLLSRNFIKWIIVANLVAWPAAYFIVNEWLQNFAYHISISPLPFIGGTILAVLIAFVTILYHTLKSASLNPAVTLKTE